ncbi:hypothetical protein [Flavobacterium sp.]|uniref:hypothetical protein n=1 Tax=Flavobacterium sp. TaxID=239 RepID=UPI003A91EBC8
MKDLDKLFESFETGIRSAKAQKPKEYLESIGLDYTTLRIGFNSGQFHHKISQAVKDHYEALGLLKKSTAAIRKSNMTAYTVFGKYALVFPLMDKNNQIVNYYALRFNMVTPQQDYLNTEGLYPCYPNVNTKRLFITPTLLDAASLVQSKALDQREAVLALHEGELFTQHEGAITALNELEEIIIINY